MYTVYSFNNSGPMGVSKSAAFFKTKEELIVRKRSLLNKQSKMVMKLKFVLMKQTT